MKEEKISYWVAVLWLLVILSLATFFGIREEHDGDSNIFSAY